VLKGFKQNHETAQSDGSAPMLGVSNYALTQLGKHLRLWDDTKRLELTGPDGGPIALIALVKQVVTAETGDVARGDTGAS